MAIGWRQLDGAWYYFNSDGRMATGMIEVGGLRYYMDPSDGRMVSGRAVEINGVTYQAAADGHLSQQVRNNRDQSSQNSGNNASGSNTGNNNTGNNVQITPANSTTGPLTTVLPTPLLMIRK
mgnify:CR=1 FL=1